MNQNPTLQTRSNTGFNSVHASILGFGHHVPALEKSSARLESDLALPCGWIARRTGFHFRRWAGNGQATSDLAILAGRKAIDSAGISKDQIGCLLLATSTPDYLLPATAPFVASQLGLQCGAMDVMNACTGFMHSLGLGSSICSATGQTVLIIAANVLSNRVNLKDKNTSGIFGDGAGAIVLGPQLGQTIPEPENGSCLGDGFQAAVLDWNWKSNGKQWNEIMIPTGGSRTPVGQENGSLDELKMVMKDGPKVFKSAVEMMKNCSQELLVKHHLTTQDFDWLLCHQASKRIVQEVGRQLGFAEHQRIWALENFGNSSAATIPIALDLQIKQKKIKAGDRVLMAAAGAGMSAGAAILHF